MNLREQGCRFTYRSSRPFGEEYQWTHPAEIQAGDVDCTDMGDDEFERFVRANDTTTGGRGDAD